MKAPPSAYPSGTALTVGSHHITIDKYVSRGGFADIYTCQISPPWNGQTLACLKRVAVPTKPQLGKLRQEVDAMRRLNNRTYIVSYIDSHARHASDGNGYVVFLLMEYCSKKGLIDLMNAHLVDKLSESVILKIMYDITNAVACMHALDPPLVHRDIKIENVLVAGDGTFKLCDFGSASPPLNPPQNVEEFRILQDDILHNTTPQYRAPEMVDLYKHQPIGQPSDIWALGVMLYKLCYYTTPFERNAINGNGNGGGGNYAIANGIFSFPAAPPYSSRLKNIIKKTLAVDPLARPNVFQLLEELCKIRGLPYPNIYPAKHPSTNSTGTRTIHTVKSVPALPVVKPAVNPVTSFIVPNQQQQQFSRYGYTGSYLPNAATGVSSMLSKVQNIQADPFAGLQKYRPTDALKPPAGNIPVSRKSIEYEGSNSRPLSMSAAGFEKMASDMPHPNKGEGVSPIESIITGMTEEETVELSPNHHTNIDSSVAFLRDLSKNSTGSSTTESKSGRSSMGSLKELLTGGNRLSRHHSMLHTSRKSSSNSNRLDFTQSKKQPLESSGRSKSQSGIDRSVSDGQHHHNHYLTHHHTTTASSYAGPKRANSIQARVKMLLNRKHAPAPHVATGYGKYTDSSTQTDGKSSLVSSPVDTLPITPATIEEADPFAGRVAPDSSSLNSPVDHVATPVRKHHSPPPKPKKPIYLRSAKVKKPTSSNVSSLYSEDVDVLEKQFKAKYPRAI